MDLAVQVTNRPSWHEYFMQLAVHASSRSTCLAHPVGAVIVKDKHVLATGYNGVPSGLPHCTDRGYCYEGVTVCSKAVLPSRAIHAEANAIAQAAKQGISIDGATIYVTLEPCLNCLKLLIACGIRRIYFARDGSAEPDTPKRELIQCCEVYQWI